MTLGRLRYNDNARRYKAKIGDVVTVIRKPTSQEIDDWGGGWSSNMDRYVGKTGIIDRIAGDNHGMRIRFDNQTSGIWYFPYTALSIIR
jgi:hypothetical protein